MGPRPGGLGRADARGRGCGAARGRRRAIGPTPGRRGCGAADGTAAGERRPARRRSSRCSRAGSGREALARARAAGALAGVAAQARSRRCRPPPRSTRFSPRESQGLRVIQVALPAPPALVDLLLELLRVTCSAGQRAPVTGRQKAIRTRRSRRLRRTLRGHTRAQARASCSGTLSPTGSRRRTRGTIGRPLSRRWLPPEPDRVDDEPGVGASRLRSGEGEAQATTDRRRTGAMLRS